MEGGGAERVVSNILLSLNDKFDFYLVMINNIVVYDLPEGTKTIGLEKKRVQNKALSILKIPILAYYYYNFLKKNDISVSLSFLNRSNFINCLTKVYGWKEKVIISEQNISTKHYTENTIQGKVGRFLIKSLYSFADIVIAVSDGINKELKEYFKLIVPVITIYNPVNNDLIATNIAQAENVKFNKFTFINVGRFQPQKNHQLLIESFSKLTNLDCKLVLLGDGFLRNDIEKQIRELVLTDKIEVLGFVDNPYNYLAAANCFVFSSDFEGFPNAILEGLSCGLPVIATDCQTGPREILDGPENPINSITKTDFGFLVPINDAEALGKSMELLYKTYHHEFNDREKYKKRAAVFGLNSIIKDYEKLLS